MILDEIPWHLRRSDARYSSRTGASSSRAQPRPTEQFNTEFASARCVSAGQRPRGLWITSRHSLVRPSGRGVFSKTCRQSVLPFCQTEGVERRAVKTMLEPLHDPAMVTACSGAVVMVGREIRNWIDWWPTRRARRKKRKGKKRKTKG